MTQLQLPEIIKNSSNFNSLKNSPHRSQIEQKDQDESTFLSIKKQVEDHTTTSKTKTQLFNSNISTPYQTQIEARYGDLQPPPKQSASMQILRNSSNKSISSMNSNIILQQQKIKRKRVKNISCLDSQGAYQSEHPRVSVNLKSNLLTSFKHKLDSISIAKEHIQQSDFSIYGLKKEKKKAVWSSSSSSLRPVIKTEGVKPSLKNSQKKTMKVNKSTSRFRV